MSSETSRRRFAKLAGTAAVAALAGCSGSSDSEGTTTGASETTTTSGETTTAEGMDSTETTTSAETETMESTEAQTETAQAETAEGGESTGTASDEGTSTFRSASDHYHGYMYVEVDGERTNVATVDSYVSPDDESGDFHFHEGSDTWHAHVEEIALGEAADELPGFDLSSTMLEFDGETYDESSSDVRVVNPTVNGEVVTPSDYVLKPGDEVEILVEMA